MAMGIGVLAREARNGVSGEAHQATEIVNGSENQSGCLPYVFLMQ